MTNQPVSPSLPDPALEASVFWLRHKNEIIGAVVFALAALTALAGYWFYKQHRDATAADALAQAKTPAALQSVATQYGGTPAGATSYLLLAEQQRNEKKFAEANATLQTFVDKNSKHELASTARMAMGANLESLGKPDEALAMYQRVSAGDPHGFNAPMALLAQVHLLKEKKQIDEARRICETMLTQYRDSFAAGEASRQLRMLKPTKAVVGTSATPVVPPAASVPSQAPVTTNGSAAPSQPPSAAAQPMIAPPASPSPPLAPPLPKP